MGTAVRATPAQIVTASEGVARPDGRLQNRFLQLFEIKRIGGGVKPVADLRSGVGVGGVQQDLPRGDVQRATDGSLEAVRLVAAEEEQIEPHDQHVASALTQIQRAHVQVVMDAPDPAGIEVAAAETGHRRAQRRGDRDPGETGLHSGIGLRGRGATRLGEKQNRKDQQDGKDSHGIEPPRGCRCCGKKRVAHVLLHSKTGPGMSNRSDAVFDFRYFVCYKIFFRGRSPPRRSERE